jgi:tripeptide aminopeptidase
MERFNKQLLFNTMSVQSASYDMILMENYILDYVTREPNTTWEADYIGNIYVTKTDGSTDNFPCVVAHMDTVHSVLPNNEFSIISHDGTWFGFNPVRRELTGIGGDDKVGIFVALSCLSHFDNIKVAFFVNEEVGCAGSGKADMTFFDDTTMVLQCDRKGYGEFVREIYGSTEMFGTEFLMAVYPILMDYNFDTITWGGITDVGELKDRGLGVVAANISCGYYNPHSKSEYIVLKDVEATLNMVMDIIEQLGDQVWAHVAPAPNWSYTGKPYTYTGRGTMSHSDLWNDGYTFGRSGTSDAALADDRDVWEKLDDEAMVDGWARHCDDIEPEMTDAVAAPYFTEFDACPSCGAYELEWYETNQDYLCNECAEFVYDTWEKEFEEGFRDTLQEVLKPTPMKLKAKKTTKKKVKARSNAVIRL